MSWLRIKRQPPIFFMECLIDYIGFMNCANQDAPPSGMYINTLPGISLESIDKIANNEQVTYLKVWQDAQIEASIRFKLDFMKKINECYTLNKKCDYEDMICDNIQEVSIAWKFLLGNQLMLYRIHSSRLNRFTTVDKKDAEDLSVYYYNEYMNALDTAMKLVDVSGCCEQECTNNPSHVWILP